MFESTIPQGQPELLRESGYRRYLDEAESQSPRLGADVVLGSRLSSLSPSLQADLQRDEHRRAAGEPLCVLEVLAACVRHAKRVTIHFCCVDKVVPLTMFPHQQHVHCPVLLAELCGMPLNLLRVMHVEPAVLQHPTDGNAQLLGEAGHYAPLSAWLWAMAWHGPRTALLPEISGHAAYRVNPGLDWERLPMDPELRAAVRRLRQGSANLRELVEWPGLSRERAGRLLNGLYLQAGLIVSRSHPVAAAESSWFGALGR